MRPRARALDVLAGRAPFIGPRIAEGTTGFVSPIEARVRLGIGYGDLAAHERDALDRRSFKRDLGSVARAFLAALIPAPGEARLTGGRPFVVSSPVDALTIDQALDAIFAEPPHDRARTIFFVHPHALNLAARDAALRDRLARADVVLPDGVGLRVAAAILGAPLRDNINGTDLLPLLCRRAVEERRPLVLLGGAAGVAATCADRLREAHSGLAIAHVFHGFLSKDEIAGARAAIDATEKPIVLVGMGTPHQETFVETHLADLGGATMVTVGGLFDFFSGRMPRAPMAVRELGLEWLYRLAQEPKRMARRYLLGNPLFVARAVMQRVKERS